MRRLLRASLVIARRDYVATVWSRSFLLFLLGPLLPVLFGAATTLLIDRDDAAPAPRVVQVALPPAQAAALVAARGRLAARLGEGALPRLARPAHIDPGAARLAGSLERPRLAAPAGQLARLSGEVGLLIDAARAPPAPPVRIRTVAIAPGAATAAGGDPRDDPRVDVARGGQFVLFFLTVLLAGMLISNLVEEKSSKVIELLAAAVPVDAIFVGKLVAMLATSLTGLAVWLGGGLAVAATALPIARLPVPAVGWAPFLLLGTAYFVSAYLLIGAVYLGIGAQAGSVREVQTLSMPLTMAQLVVFALATGAAAHPERPLAIVAAVVPWSSPLAMIARAALRPALWPHLLALAWQFVALALSVRLGARLFRTNILRSGRGRPA